MLYLQQIINESTTITSSCHNLRDLIFTTISDKVLESGTFSSFSYLDHLPVFVKLNTTPQVANTKPIHNVIWDYSNLNAPLLTSNLINTDWAGILNNDVDTATELFINAIHEAASTSIPIKHKTSYKQ